MSEYKSLSDIVRANKDARVGNGFVVAGNKLYTEKDGEVVSQQISGYTGRLTSRGIVDYAPKYSSTKRSEETQLEL